jgi:hypothetical protein
MLAFRQSRPTRAVLFYRQREPRIASAKLKRVACIQRSARSTTMKFSSQEEKDKWLLDHPGELPPEDSDPQDPAPKADPTPGDDSPEVKADKAKIAELEKQLLQAGHKIETLKKEKKTPSDTPAALDDETLAQRINDGVEQALNERLPNQQLAEAEANATRILAERDALLATLRSKGNRSSGSGDAGQKPPIKPDLPLTPAEERFTRAPYNLSPEEIINNRE